MPLTKQRDRGAVMTTSTTLSGIHHASVTVTDIEASVAWYCEVLWFCVLLEDEHCGRTPGYGIVLGPPDWSFCITLHVDTRTPREHVSFRLANRFRLEAWADRLTDFGVDHDPIRDLGGSSVLVFRDPDGIPLELIAFA
jgi:glyoxylase I family protein